MIVGDLHGQLADLLYILQKHGLPSDKTQYIFNGDFVDRGAYGVEVFLLVMALKLVYRDFVHCNRGNHEDVSLNGRFGFANEVRHSTTPWQVGIPENDDPPPPPRSRTLCTVGVPADCCPLIANRCRSRSACRQLSAKCRGLTANRRRLAPSQATTRTFFSLTRNPSHTASVSVGEPA